MFASVAALLVFILSSVLTVLIQHRPISFNVPLTGRSYNCPYYCVFPLAALVLLLCGSIHWADVGRGLLGDAHTRPYGLVVLILALTYITASLELSGVLSFGALTVRRSHLGSTFGCSTVACRAEGILYHYLHCMHAGNL